MRDGTAEPISRDQILRHARGQGNINFPCSAGHEQDWQPSYPVDPDSAIYDGHTYIHTYIQVYWVTQLRTDGIHCRESADTEPVNLKVVVPNGCCFVWQVTMDQLVCDSLSHTHYWYEVGMLKVPACPHLTNYNCYYIQ